MTCDARSIHDRAREILSRKFSIYLSIRDCFLLSIVPVVDSVLGWFATAAPRNVGAAVA